MKNVAFMGIDSPTVSGILVMTKGERRAKELGVSKHWPHCYKLIIEIPLVQKKEAISRSSLLVSWLMDKTVELLECCSSYYTPQEYIDKKEHEVCRCGPPVQPRD